MTHGTWQTTGGGGSGGPPVELLVLALVLIVGGGAAAGIAQAVAQVAVLLLTVVAVVVMAVVAGAVAYVVYRRRTGRPLLRMQPLVQVRELDLPQRQSWILGAPKPQALPQVTNVFIGGHHVHGDPDGLPVVRGELISRDDADL